MLNLDKLRARPKDFDDVLPPIDELPDGTILGASSVTLPGPRGARPRVILKRKAVTIDQVRETQPAFAGAWLDGMPRRFSRQFPIQLQAAEAMQGGGMIAPHFCDGQGSYAEDYSLIDLRAAYLQIFSRVCWDVEYFRGSPSERFFAPGTGKAPLSEYPFPTSYKTLYACVVSLCLPASWLTIVTKGTPVMVRTINYRRNPSLVCFVSDVLHAVAWWMVTACGACRVNTDSYLVPERRQVDAEKFLRWLALDYHIKHRGRTEVWHLNAYRVGDKESLPYAAASGLAEPIDNLSIAGEQAEWLLGRFQGLTTRMGMPDTQ